MVNHYRNRVGLKSESGFRGVITFKYRDGVVVTIKGECIVSDTKYYSPISKTNTKEL